MRGLAALLFALGALSASEPSTIVIKAADGGMITTDVYGSGDHGVVLAHGGRFDRKSWRPQALELAAAGFHVVSIDFRAAVEMREGRETPCLYDEECLAKDVLAAVQYLKRRGVRSVSLIGGSLGGGAAAQAAVESPDIDGVVLLAHMTIESPERMRGRKFFIVARNDRGGNDRPRLDDIRAQYAKATGPKELLVVEGAAHAQAMFDTPDGPRLMREIVRFLRQ
jgi:pimeloyl-ACP methyl ester carboxylesterase